MAPQFWEIFSTNVVLNATLRFGFLRTVYVLTAFLLIEELVSDKPYDIKSLVVTVVVFVHHMLR